MPGKKKEESEGKDFNWKEAIVDTLAEVRSHKEKFDNIKQTQEEIKTTHKEHCEKEEKDWVGFKDTVCKKIDKIKCPEAETIAAIKANGLAKESKFKTLTTSVDGYKDSVIGFKESVDKVLLNTEKERGEREGEKKAWRKLWIRISYALGGTGTIAGIVTKITGLW